MSTRIDLTALDCYGAYVNPRNQDSPCDKPETHMRLICDTEDDNAIRVKEAPVLVPITKLSTECTYIATSLGRGAVGFNPSLSAPLITYIIRGSIG